MKHRVTAALLFCLFTLPVFGGPFGLEKGMTKQQIIALVGKSKVIEDKGEFLRVSTVPKPYGYFEWYTLCISPTQGLLKILATGKDIETSGDGSAVREKFDEIHTGLITNYGAPKDDLDQLKSGSIWNEPQDFMMGIVKKDRLLTSYWFPINRSDRVTAVAEDFLATGSDSGYVEVGYEFEGWDAFADKLKAEQDSNL